MTHFKLACGAVAIMALVTTFAIGRSPQLVESPAPDQPTVQERETARTELAKAMTTFQEAPRVVQTETIKFEDRDLKPPPVSASAEAKIEPKKPEVKKDICARNGMQKIKHGRHGWRCKRK